ncbi:hypothetical protein VQ03_20110 [Methylobacterium tarhaniae]|uniref:Uncharacterized protein n=1 Tax=Methylobacterium tarhaniae TaxID=1187852 RepID=A0A0J6SU27_9HYPH|nr:hypothetical protein VQ03_20110 [Methylobacterium tarhaniae]
MRVEGVVLARAQAGQGAPMPDGGRIVGAPAQPTSWIGRPFVQALGDDRRMDAGAEHVLLLPRPARQVFRQAAILRVVEQVADPRLVPAPAAGGRVAPETPGSAMTAPSSSPCDRAKARKALSCPSRPWPLVACSSVETRA